MAELKAGCPVTVFVLGYLLLKGTCHSVYQDSEFGVWKAKVLVSQTAHGYKQGEIYEFAAHEVAPNETVKESKQRLGGAVYTLSYRYIKSSLEN